MTMLLAGHDTTALALTYAWHLLSEHPEAERRVHEEVDAVVDDCLRKRPGFERLDAGAALDAVSIGGALDAGHGTSAQLWPHAHGTDAMYLALIRKTP